MASTEGEEVTVASKSTEKEQDSIHKKEMLLEDKFKAAVKVIHSLPKDGPYQPSNGTKLKFYGLFKQSTEGPCGLKKPGFWDVVGRYKWDAWNDLGQMTKEEAMTQYIENLKAIVETMSWDGNVEDFLHSIGPFYEFVNLQGNEMVHIKETIDRLTSSSSSSNSSSDPPTPINSTNTSPIKIVGRESRGGSGHGTVEVQVESRTATFANHVSQSNTKPLTNGYHNSEHNHSHSVPPPTPTHTYSNSRKNSVTAQSNVLQDTEELDEVMDVSLTPNPVALCQQDLEQDDSSTLYQVNTRSTPPAPPLVEATSGTESEKYYSGDSEPDVEEKQLPPELSAKTFSSIPVPASHSSSQTWKTLAPNRKKSNPKPNGGAGLNIFCPSADVILQSTVDRLNRDVDHILARLRILETAYASSVDVTDGGNRVVLSRNRRRPPMFFGGLSYTAIALLAAWPFAVHFLIRLMSWWWARRGRIFATRRRLL